MPREKNRKHFESCFFKTTLPDEVRAADAGCPELELGTSADWPGVWSMHRACTMSDCFEAIHGAETEDLQNNCALCENMPERLIESSKVAENYG